MSDVLGVSGQITGHDAKADQIIGIVSASNAEFPTIYSNQLSIIGGLSNLEGLITNVDGLVN